MASRRSDAEGDDPGDRGGTPVGYEEYFSGTSMAATPAIGTAALVAGEFPGLLEKPPALKRLVMGTGQPLPATPGKTVTGDVANAGGAVTGTAPRISRFSLAGATSDDAPTIRANVVDLQGPLAPNDLTVRVDGDPRGNLSYNPNSGVLSLAGGRMEEGRHSVRITAAAPQNLTPRGAGPSGWSGPDRQRRRERSPGFTGPPSLA